MFSSLAFQNATNNIISFIIVTNMSISNDNKSLNKCILRVLKLCSHETWSWLLHRYSVFTVATEWTMSAQYVLCGHTSVQYALSGQFLLVPLILFGKVNVLVDTSAQIKVPKAREGPDFTQQAVVTALLLQQQLHVYGWPGCVYGQPVWRPF